MIMDIVLFLCLSFFFVVLLLLLPLLFFFLESKVMYGVMYCMRTYTCLRNHVGPAATARLGPPTSRGISAWNLPGPCAQPIARDLWIRIGERHQHDATLT